MTDIGEMTAEETLAHFGVKGMKWGVKKAVSPVTKAAKVYDKGYNRAALEVNRRQTAKTQRHADRKTLTAKAGDKIIGSKRMDKHLNKKLSELAGEQDRIKKGQLTLNDVLKYNQHVSLVSIGFGAAMNRVESKKS